MKKIYFIGGTMGVGKTSACKQLKNMLEHSVYLDGDWCWDMNPFTVSNETKRMVIDNITHILNNFIHCTAYEHIIFCWVMHEQYIIDDIISKLHLQSCKLVNVSLVCNEDVLRTHLQKDVNEGIRSVEIIQKSMQQLHLYKELSTMQIDVSDCDVIQVANKIYELSCIEN